MALIKHVNTHELAARVGSVADNNKKLQTYSNTIQHNVTYLIADIMTKQFIRPPYQLKCNMVQRYSLLSTV